MSKDMLGSVVRAAVGVPQNRLDVLAKIASAMSADNLAGEAWHKHLKILLQEGLPFSEAVVEKLLDVIATVKVAGVVSFVAAEKFHLGETIDGIKVIWLGDNFKKHFLPKIESGEIAAEELVVNVLLKASHDPAIVTALGGEDNVEISLGQFWEFLKTADRNFWYIAYIRDIEGVLWAVNARWYGDGLSVEASSFGSPHAWHASSRFLSR